MDFLRVFNTVEKEYDRVIASGVVVAMTINLNTKVKKVHLEIGGIFTEKINKKTREILWEYNVEDVELIIKIRDSWDTYVLCKTMDGLGGCVKKTLKEIVENKA